MLRNQMKIALRNLWKNKSFSIINILGLSLGMACCFLIILYCWHEFNYDKFHPNGSDIFRIEYHINFENEINIGRIPPTIGPALKEYFPEIESVARFYDRDLSVELPKDQKQFELENVFFVDSTVFDVFTFDFMEGNAFQALDRPESVVISKSTAEKLFGTTDVSGKMLRLAGIDGFQITGVVNDWPDNSHLEFSMLLPYSAMISVEPPHAQDVTRHVLQNNWIATHSYTYVRLFPNQNPERVNTRLKDFIQEKGNEQFRDKQSFTLLPISDIHLYAAEGGPKPAGNVEYLYLFLLIGIITLSMACINFINLSTAGSMARSREVGVRKVLGAQRSYLISQFLGESMFLSFIAFVISLMITILTLPFLNNLTALNIPLSTLTSPLLVGVFIAIFLFTGLLAGLYPAFLVSNFKPVEVLSGRTRSGKKSRNNWLGNVLIIVQFVAAIGFIGGATTLYLQLEHLKNQPLGFNHELQLSLPVNSGNNINALFRPGDATLRQRMNTFDDQLMMHPNIKAVTQCYLPPGLGAVARNVWNDKVTPEDNFYARILSVDYDYVETFELALVAGRDFDESYGTDHLSSFLINEKAVDALGWETPLAAVGQPMTLEGKEGMVVGVLKDFNYTNLRNAIDPLVFEVRPGAFGYFGVRLENADIATTLSFIEDKWKTAFPEKVFEYTFLDESINEAYIAENRLAKIIRYFAILAIVISCFGLFGLAALLIRQRFKEIGIRKVLGATVWQILALVSRDFLKLAGVALIIAAPLTCYTAKDWLNAFAYRIEFPWWVTLVSGVLVMVIAFITISTQSTRAALANPMDAIRDE